MERERENGKGILFGVLGVMTLVIAILGASLAYFTASDSSEKNAVSVESATVTITYVDGQIINATNLIPATQDIATTAYQRTENQCKDSVKDGYNVCAVYSFGVHNGGASAREVVGEILTTTLKDNCEVTETDNCVPERQFENLSYMVYEVTESGKTPVSTSLTKFARTGSTTTLFNNGTEFNSISIDYGKTKNYEVLIWLNEKAEGNVADDDGSGNQDFEQGLSYTGTVTITVKDQTDRITGE